MYGTWAVLQAGLLTMALLSSPHAAAAQSRTIDITADKNSRYKIAGQDPPAIRAHAGEHLLLRITANRGKTWNRDGSIHGFTLLRAKDRSKVEGWNLLLHSGLNEFQVVAPSEPGEYVVVCTVICSDDHEGMNMKFTVVP
jgi:hypothetical protein